MLNLAVNPMRILEQGWIGVGAENLDGVACSGNEPDVKWPLPKRCCIGRSGGTS